MSRIVVGLSGGVDSSVAALLLKEQGHEVIGCRMRTFDTDAAKAEEESAAEVAEKLGIPLISEDFREEFGREVIETFASEYLAGRTPNPCLLCNRKVKWQALMKTMRETGADGVATGHYAAAGESAGRYFIKSVAAEKDQSYALYNLTQEEIAVTRFPLSGMDKGEVRKIAQSAGLVTADRPDSMEICFIPGNDYVGFLKEKFGLEDRPGNFIDPEGRILGTHPGIAHMTVGQRKGLGIALGKKVFVKELRPLTNEAVLADDADVFSKSLRMDRVNFQLAEEKELTEAARIKIRYADPGCPGVIEKEEGGTFRVTFERPVRAVTPGQGVVAYDGEGRILLGGSILS